MYSLTSRQLSTLRYVRAHGTSLEMLRKCNQITLWSLLHRKLVVFREGALLITDDGMEALDGYNASRLAMRLRDSNISDRCVALLRVSKVLKMRRQAA